MTSKIERLLKSYTNCRKSWECWCFMANFNVEKNNLRIVVNVNNNPLLFHLRFLALKDFCIEAYKILKNSKNNPDNIFTQLKEFENVNADKSFEVNECLISLDNETQTITHICNVRDKFYAHLDKESNDYIDDFKVRNILKCFMAIEKAIIVLSSEETLKRCLDNITSRNEFSL